MTEVTVTVMGAEQRQAVQAFKDGVMAMAAAFPRPDGSPWAVLGGDLLDEDGHLAGRVEVAVRVNDAEEFLPALRRWAKAE